MNPYNLVKQFVTTFERPVGFNEANLNLSYELLEEEYTEVTDEIDLAWQIEDQRVSFTGAVDRMALTEELADLMYVVNYAAVILELPLNEVFEEKHRANMTKLGNDGKPVLRDDGKILKGPNYQKPDYSKFFNE